IAAGADLEARDESGETPLHATARSGVVQTMRILLRAGADPDAPNGDGNTPLHITAVWGRADAGVRLIKFGADLSITNNQGSTPLEMAKEHDARKGTDVSDRYQTAAEERDSQTDS
ncbi:MAG: ankyrin repeat domain-containing protein, partial [Gammaproteobacteria bacterium]|nr:ankyrin repeat domain-containing protein [Gammaproteobacteria bacterium]